MFSLLGVWAHGDYCAINSKTGGVVMLGRRWVLTFPTFCVHYAADDDAILIVTDLL